MRTELPRQRVLNCSAVWACRDADPAVHDRLLDRARRLRLPAEVRRVAAELDQVASGVWAVQHLLARGVLWVDLDRPLTSSTTVHQTTQHQRRPSWLLDI